MVSKKYTVLTVLLLTMGVASYAQTAAWDWKDSSVVPVKSITQYNEFLQNKNPFPAKPRNAWEFSAGLGTSSVTGDTKAKMGLGASLTLRKALNNIFSYRLGYFYSYNVGGNGQRYDYYGRPVYVTAPLSPVYANKYKNNSHNFAVDLIASLNTFSNYRGDPTSNLYLLAGVGVTLSTTKVIPVGSTSSEYVFEDHIPQTQLLAVTGHTLIFTTFDVGAGYAYKINKKFNVGIEERIISPVKHVNYVTGYNSQTGTKNAYYYTALKLNFNLL